MTLGISKHPGLVLIRSIIDGMIDHVSEDLNKSITSSSCKEGKKKLNLLIKDSGVKSQGVYFA